MNKKLRLLVASISCSVIAASDSTAQISMMQDYKNFYSRTIGTFQGINFREAGFSGIYPIPGTNGTEFWICSDRGVNVDAANANPSACRPTYDKIYAFPTYAPKIHRIRLRGDSMQILQTIPMRRPDGTNATGIINPTGFGSTATEVASTDTVQDCANFGMKTTAKDVWGIDAEGIAIDREGNFWICEEGGPTVWKIGQNGIVQKRFTPYATRPGAEAIDVAIDTAFGYRKNNRGFEGITIAPNGKIYAMIQSPLLYPTKTIGENTRVHRLLEIDPVTNATRMFAYLNDGIIGASGSNQIRLRDWKIGDMAAINDTTFLVLEAALRGTNDVKRVYKISLNGATPVTSGLYGTSTLEALVDSAGLAANGIVPVKKTLFMDLLAHGWDPALDKAEGIAIINDSTIAISNDNDYGQTSPLENGIATATTNMSHVVTYRLSGSNKLTDYVAPSSTLTPGLTGVSTSSTPYIVPTVPGAYFRSLLTVGETAATGSYRMVGIMDGVGAYDNNDGTFTVLINHELGNTSGVTRAHGSTGAFVSKWTVRKSDMAVLSGTDLIRSVNVWNSATSSYITYNAAFPSTSAAFGRFCSADLPEVSAFYNSRTGKGTMERIFMNGEESGSEGRAFGHVVTGVDAGKSYQLPSLGRFSWENSVASPIESDTTVVIGMDDATPGQVYVYVGTKRASGNEVEKAGLVGGNLYGVAVSGMITEVNTMTPTSGTTFSLVNMGDVRNISGSTLNSNSNAAGVTNFLRPEDGAWDPSSPNDFYFVTTNSFTSPSRLWRLRFTNAANPALGGTIEAVLDGTEGPKMMDNLTIDNYGHVLIQEDPGNNVHLAKTWQYNIATDEIKLIASHDSTRFLTSGPHYLTQDEEASGVIDVEKILGPGHFLVVDQAHYSQPGELVEGGQFLHFFNPDTYNAAPEAEVTGNSVVINNGATIANYADSTNYGDVNTGNNTSRNFVIHNLGQGSLKVNSLSISGIDAAQFSITSMPTLPLTIAAGASYTISVRFAPTTGGTKNAMLHIGSNDVTEADYHFAIKGNAIENPEISIEGNSVAVIDGDMTPGGANNTDFGTVVMGSDVTKSFVIKNNGAGNLNVSGIAISGDNAADYVITGAPSFPATIPTSGSYTVNIKFAPGATGVRNAMVTVSSNDADEATFEFAVKGTGVNAASVNNLATSTEVKLYPNPTKEIATLAIDLFAAGKVNITVMDVQGKIVIPAISKEMSAGKHNVDINTHALENGIYSVRVEHGAANTTIKMVVMH